MFPFEDENDDLPWDDYGAALRPDEFQLKSTSRLGKAPLTNDLADVQACCILAASLLHPCCILPASLLQIAASLLHPCCILAAVATATDAKQKHHPPLTSP